MFVVSLGAVATSILYVVLGVLMPSGRYLPDRDVNDLSDAEEPSRKHLAIACLFLLRGCPRAPRCTGVHWQRLVPAHVVQHIHCLRTWNDDS